MSLDLDKITRGFYRCNSSYCWGTTTNTAIDTLSHGLLASSFAGLLLKVLGAFVFFNAAPVLKLFNAKLEVFELRAKNHGKAKGKLC